MAYYLSPVANDSQTSTSGAPLNGGFVYTYAAGTTTPQATFTDNTGGTPQANPIVLNVYGLPASPIWLTGGQAYKFVIKDSLGNTIRTIDNVTGVNDLSAVPPAVLVSRAYAEYTANADLTTIIPGDDTIPQNTEGTQIISVSITPKSATNRIRLRFQGEFALLSTGSAGFALFSSASANAIKSTLAAAIGATLPTPVVTEYEYVPGTTSALTFTVRVGPIAANTMRMNGNTSARFFGGTMGATLVVEEITP